MSKRWKPENGETYFYFNPNSFSNVFWKRWGIQPHIDHDLYQNGNCFRTKAEAEAAAEKVKELLLSLHETVTDCNQSPKLTAEVFDRPDCPEWAKFAAFHNGNLVFTDQEPGIDEHGFIVSANDAARIEKAAIIPLKNNKHYLPQLIKRPIKETKLPDWCKVGEWCYCGIGKRKYTKIKKVLDASILAGEYDTFTADFINSGEVLPARLRPYNAEEMKALVGRTVDSDNGARYLVTKFYDTCGGEVCIDGIYYSVDWLLAKFTINNTPCGVLKHLENGEWVK